MKKVLKIFSFALLLTCVFGDGGFCGIEPPKDGKSCSESGSVASKKSTEKEIEDKLFDKLVFDDFPENETEIWAKRFYSKMGFTTKYDWPIRNILDEAEDFIVNDAQVAIDKLNAILEKYPDSPRAKYDLVRALQYRFYERERTETLTEEQRLEHVLDCVHRFTDIISMFKPLEETAAEDLDEEDESEYVLPPTILNSAFHQAVQECESMNLTKLSAEIVEKMFEISPGHANSERYHIILIEKYFVLDDVENFETAVERAREKFPTSMLVKFFYGLMLKKVGKKKEGMKLLKEIEYDGDGAYSFADEMRQIGRSLYNAGKVSQAHDLFRETSKTHGFLSTFQRPIMTFPDLEAVPLWNAEEQVGLTKHDEEFQILKEKWTEIKEEAVKVMGNMSEGWLSHFRSLNDQNLIVGQGNWSVYPIYKWGKRKAFSCSKAPSTCAFLKEKFPLAAHFSLGVTKFEVLFGKTRVIPHCGPVNARLRLLLPLQAPKDQSLFKYRVSKDTAVPFMEGNPVVIDDSFEHEMVNESDEAVVWLSIDFPHPDLQYGAEKKIGLSDYAKRIFLSI